MTKTERKEKAKADFPAASALAERYGLKLVMHNNWGMYNLSNGDLWLVSLYPTTGTVTFSTRHALKPDVSGIPKDWTLETAVEHFSMLMG